MGWLFLALGLTLWREELIYVAFRWFAGRESRHKFDLFTKSSSNHDWSLIGHQLVASLFLMTYYVALLALLAPHLWAAISYLSHVGAFFENVHVCKSDALKWSMLTYYRTSFVRFRTNIDYP